jgi:hypothetical protein
MNSEENGAAISVFLSFSSADYEIARDLLRELRRRQAHVWDYSRRGDELPVGASLSVELQKRIESSDYFVALMTPHKPTVVLSQPAASKPMAGALVV